MKKTFTKTALIVLILSMLFSTSCSLIGGGTIDPKRLDAPSGLRIEDGCLYWNPVEYATKYLVSIDGNQYYSEDYRYSLSNVQNGEHVFKVKAMGDGVLYSSSDFSPEFKGTVANDVQNNENDDSQNNGGTNDNSQNNNQNDNNNQNNDNATTIGYDRYTLTDIPDSPQLMYTYTERENNVYVYYVGRVDNVPITYSATERHDGVHTKTITYSKSQVTEEIITTSKEACLSSVVSKETESSITIEAGFNVGVKANIGSIYEVDTNFNVSKSYSVKNTVGSTDGYSYTNATDTTNGYIQEYGKDVSIPLDQSYEAGYYRYTLFAECDIYAFVVYDSLDNAVNISYDLSAIDGSFFYDLDRCDDRDFGPTGEYEELLTMGASSFNADGLFNYRWQYNINYVLNGGTFAESVENIYNIDDGISLPTPTKTYFDFGGWYYDENFNNVADSEAIKLNPRDITLYAKWNAINDSVSFAGGMMSTAALANARHTYECTYWFNASKILQYLNDGYKVEVVGIYTAGVPEEFDGSRDPSDIIIEFGLITNGSDSFTLIDDTEYRNMHPGTQSGGSLSFYMDADDLNQYNAIRLNLSVQTNDTAVLGIAGRDAGWFDGIRIEIRYSK